MTFRAVALGNDETSTNVNTHNITVPATVEAGDVMIVMSSQNTGADVHSIGGGGTGVTWTSRSGMDYNTTLTGTRLWSATAVADSAGSTITVSSDGSGRFISVLYVEADALEDGILVALTTDTTADTGVTWPSVTTPEDGWSVIGLNVIRAAATTAPTITASPSGATVDGSVNTAFGTSPNFRITALHVTDPPTAGSVSPGSATCSTNVTSNLYTIALAPVVTTPLETLSYWNDGTDWFPIVTYWNDGSAWR